MLKQGTLPNSSSTAQTQKRVLLGPTRPEPFNFATDRRARRMSTSDTQPAEPFVPLVNQVNQFFQE